MRSILPKKNDFLMHRSSLLSDAVAGVTVAIVALPLALGFGLTSGMSAGAGLTTAIIAGLIAALFGGSRYQVSGPTGAMTVILIPIIATYGVDAIPLLGVLAGLMVLAMSILKLGDIINRVPWSVVEGFTVGIALVIALQQIPLIFQIKKGSGDRSLPVAWNTIADAVAIGIKWQSILIVALTLLVKFQYPKVAQLLRIQFHIPASFIAIVAVTLMSKALSLDISKIGDIPRGIGTWKGSTLSFQHITSLLWPAFLIGILCAIESLLSARVADGMVHAKEGDRYNPNQELTGQGLATIAASLFGGMPATGAIARTSVNVRSGAKSRYSAIFHSAVLLLVALLLAPIVSQIPSAAIAGVLLGTSYRILNPTSLRESLRTTRTEALVLLITAGATLAIDLIWGIGIGIILHLAFTARAKRQIRQ